MESGSKSFAGDLLFYLVRTYGPVPLLEKDFPMDTPSDELQLPRNTVDECFDFIVSELKGAQNDGLLDDASTDKVSGYTVLIRRLHRRLSSRH